MRLCNLSRLPQPKRRGCRGDATAAFDLTEDLKEVKSNGIQIIFMHNTYFLCIFIMIMNPLFLSHQDAGGTNDPISPQGRAG